MAKTKSSSRVPSQDTRIRGSTVTGVLESAWQLLREIDVRIPPAVITLVDVRSRRLVAGYFARSRWRRRGGRAHEVAISPNLIGDSKDLVGTLLHEAAHAILYQDGGNGGIGAGGYYHLRSFRDLCAEFGLRCQFKDTRYGFSITSWPNGRLPARFLPVQNLLSKRLPPGTAAPTYRPMRGKPLPVPGHTLLVCGCANQKRTIYVKKTVLQVGGILCAFCREPFRLPE